MPREVELPIGVAKILPALIDIGRGLAPQAELTLTDISYADRGGDPVPVFRMRAGSPHPRLWVIERPEAADPNAGMRDPDATSRKEAGE